MMVSPALGVNAIVNAVQGYLVDAKMNGEIDCCRYRGSPDHDRIGLTGESRWQRTIEPNHPGMRDA